MAIDQYLKEVRRYPLLGQEEERQFAKLAKTGDLNSRQHLINSNLRLVISIAAEYSRNGILEDLIQEGNQGLIKAADGFNPDLGYRFSTYATWWIKQGIFSYFEKLDDIRLPPEQRKLRKMVCGIITDYLCTHSEEPSHEQIAAELSRYNGKKYSGNDVKELLMMYESIKVSSLNRQVGEDADAERMDFIEGADGRDNLEAMAGASTADAVLSQIRQLDADDLTRKVLEEKLYNTIQFGELADSLGLTKERVKQNYNKGIRLLRNALKNNPQFMSSVRLPTDAGQ